MHTLVCCHWLCVNANEMWHSSSNGDRIWSASKGPSHFSHCAAKKHSHQGWICLPMAYAAVKRMGSHFSLSAGSGWLYGRSILLWHLRLMMRRPLLFQEEIFSRSESSYTGLGLPLVKGIANISLCKWMDFPLFLCGWSLSLALINYTRCMTRTKAAVVCH